MAITARAYTLPDPAFGPGSKGYQVRMRIRNKIQESEALGIDALRIESQVDNNNYSTVDDDSSEDDGNTEGASSTARTYVGAGSYF